MYTHKKNTITKIMLMGLISIGIGIVISLIFSDGHFHRNLKSWGFNIGYSLMIGMGLFSTGYFYSMFKNTVIEWIKHPIRSLIISIVVMTLYSFIIILFFNWLWFVFILNHSWNNIFHDNKILFIAEYIVFCIIALFSFARSFFNDWRQSLISEQKLKEEAVKLQYKVLSNQVNPHFLFNALNVLNSLIAIDSDRAQNFVNKLSTFYRDLLNFKDKDIIALDEEINFVNNYIQLQQERFGDNIKYNNKLVKTQHYQVIPMTLQLLVENAIKHNQITRDKQLIIEIYSEDNYIFVKNNCHAYPNPRDGEHFGLQSLKERYKFLTDQDLHIFHDKQFFIVQIPLLNTKR